LKSVYKTKDVQPVVRCVLLSLDPNLPDMTCLTPCHSTPGPAGTLIFLTIKSERSHPEGCSNRGHSPLRRENI